MTGLAIGVAGVLLLLLFGGVALALVAALALGGKRGPRWVKKHELAIVRGRLRKVRQDKAEEQLMSELAEAAGFEVDA